ncbi:MAG: deoxyribonuclease IV [Acidobacteriota bacterium]|nr:deoxyribonuclease IV [Blastocatellia bacterium]MDW8239502.1 deoxyribonuclease IV [Acidobacteriota bacterium]
MRIGVHASIAGSLANAIAEAHQLGCEAVQIFSRNPRGWASRPLSKQDVNDFIAARERTGIAPVVVHGVYLINLASAEAETRQLSVSAFRDELRRAAALEADYVVIHPGSAKQDSAEQAIARCIAGIKTAARGLQLKGLRILIENTAGQGGQIGRTFEQLAAILNGLDELPVGCCLDTAHLYAAGYDIATPTGFKHTMASISASIGWERIYLIHANDTRIALGGAVDRHWHIGQGNIGCAGFRRLVRHPALKQLPFILETPRHTREDDHKNMTTLRRLTQAP